MPDGKNRSKAVVYAKIVTELERADAEASLVLRAKSGAFEPIERAIAYKVGVAGREK